jgi:hypothetical protein
MTKRDYIPESFSGLLNWLNNFALCIEENPTLFGVPAPKFQELKDSILAYAEAYVKAIMPNAGSTDRLIRRLTAEKARAEARRIVNSCLRYGETVKDEDRLNLGLTIRDTKPTAAHKPTNTILVLIDSSMIRRLTLKYMNEENRSRSKPKGIHGAEILWGVLPAPPETVEELVHSDFSIRSPHTFEFDDKQRGLTAYFVLRWENTRGQKGPWSKIYSAIIP